MKITWSVPVFSQELGSGRGDLVRARALIEALRARGHDVRVVAATDRPGRGVEESVHRRLADGLLPEAGRLALRDVARWWRSRGHGRRVARAAREQGAEVLVETQVHGVVSGSLAARDTGLPLVLDDVSPSAEAVRLGAGLPGLGRWLFDRQRAAADLLVAPSERIRELVDGLEVGSVPVAVIPNGVDLGAHRRTGLHDARRALGVGKEEVVLGFVGSFQPWHDVSLLVQAAAALEAVSRVRLLLVGDGPEREPALEVAREAGIEGRIVAPGAVSPDRVPELLAACDVGVLPGTNDYGHPMKLLEYAAAGLPVVAPDVPRVREMVEDGLVGVLFTAGDAVSLGTALERLVQSPGLRSCLSGQVRTRVDEDMDWGARGRQLEGELERSVRGSISDDSASTGRPVGPRPGRPSHPSPSPPSDPDPRRPGDPSSGRRTDAESRR